MGRELGEGWMMGEEEGVGLAGFINQNFTTLHQEVHTAGKKELQITFSTNLNREKNLICKKFVVIAI